MKINLQLFAYTGNSVVDFLNSEGKDSSFEARRKIATDAGITNYTGTASQNTTLLNFLRDGTPVTTTDDTSGTTATTADDISGGATTTNTAAGEKTIPKGVDKSDWDIMGSSFEESEETASKKDKADEYLTGYTEAASKTDIVDQATKDTINSKFVTPDSVLKADAYLSNQLSAIQSGKTSYTDQVNDMISKIMNRDKFEYDADSDQLFQQALASAMNSGKSAMQDTIGQASALTGGYGSTYATSAGNQAYNAFIEDAYNNLPEYYQMALNAYQMEGQEMYQQLGMLSDADAREYGRMVDAYNATSQYRNQAYNEAYAQHQDSINNAFNYANLQLNENAQLVNNAYNLYSVYSNEYENAYGKEFDLWNTSVAQAVQRATFGNSDYWNQTNYDEGVRQFNETMAENKRQFDMTFTENQRQFNETMAYNKSRGSSGGGGGGGGGGGYLKNPSEKQFASALAAFENGGDAGLAQYIDTVSSSVDTEALVAYAHKYGKTGADKFAENSFKISPNNGQILR